MTLERRALRTGVVSCGVKVGMLSTQRTIFTLCSVREALQKDIGRDGVVEGTAWQQAAHTVQEERGEDGKAVRAVILTL